jgi:hypothetical protein
MNFCPGFPLNKTENVTSSGGMKTKSENQRDIFGFEVENLLRLESSDLDFHSNQIIVNDLTNFERIAGEI